MAGIGFELRKLLRKDTLSGLLQAYAFAGIIGSGPWILSIVGILAIGLLSHAVVVPSFLVTQFQTSVTYLITISLVLTGGLQLAFTRFVSDRLFEHSDDSVVPNLNGILLMVLSGAAVFSMSSLFAVFSDLGVIYRLLLMAGFMLLGPGLAMGLYALSQQREAGNVPRLGPSLTIWPAAFWWITTTSKSVVAEPFWASSFSRIFCEPESPAPVPTETTFTPGWAFSNIGPRKSLT